MASPGSSDVSSRNLESMPAASMDYRQLAALVDSMKKVVLVAKRNVINKLTRRIKCLRTKRNANEDEHIKRKINRIIKEISITKEFDVRRVSKFVLACEQTVSGLSRMRTVSPHLVCLTRLSEDKSLALFVKKWRAKHSDWRILANFLLSKNTSRHFKRSEQKKNITEDALIVERELIYARMLAEMDGLAGADVNKPLAERTSKNKKYKKKTNENKTLPETADDVLDACPVLGTADFLNEQRNNAALEEDGTVGVWTDGDGTAEDIDESDLFTFNLVDDDKVHLLEVPGREKPHAGENNSDEKEERITKVANRLFSKAALYDSNTEEACKSRKADGSSFYKELPGDTHNTSLQKRKKKMNDVQHPVAGNSIQSPVTGNSIVKTVINVEELIKEDRSDFINILQTVPSGFPKAKTCRKKSGFFVGGEDEIDEKLGLSKAQQDRAWKNQKSVTMGYKGIKDSDKTWLQSTFTESLNNQIHKPKKLKDGKLAEGGNLKKKVFESKPGPSSHSQPFGESTEQARGEREKAPPAEPPASVLTDTLHPSWQASRKRKEQMQLLKSGPKNSKLTFTDD